MKYKRTIVLLAVMVCVLFSTATQAFALFDIVYNPTELAALGKIFSSDASMLAKTIAIYNETAKTYMQVTNDYNLAKQMAERIKDKRTYLTLAERLTNERVQNKYGETLNWGAVMNGDVAHAGTAWHDSTRAIGDTSYLSNEQIGNSRRLAELASIEAADASSTRCLEAVAGYKAARAANQAAVDALSKDSLDEGDATNAQIEQLNLMNAALTQQLAEEQSQGAVRACAAEQATIQTKIERDRLADQQRYSSDLAAARATQPATMDPSTSYAVLTGYLIK